MTKQTINLGTGELTGDGESIRSAFIKVNENFTELYDRDINTDAQTLTLVGDTLSISGGNSVTITHPTIPTSTSELTNDSGFITSALQAGDAFDVKGSVFADDSTLLVDGVNGSIPYSVLSNAPTALSDFSNDLDYAGIVGGAIQANGLPSGTEVTDGIYAKDGQALSIGYKDYSGLNTSIFVDETTGVQFWKDVTFDNVTVDFTTSSIVNTPFAETANLATVATSGDYDDLTNKPTDLVRTTMTSAIDANSFDISNLFAITLQTQTSAVTGATEGTVVIADGSGWDPLGNGRKSMVVYLGGAWREIAAVPGV
jgi:hypothetical protein